MLKKNVSKVLLFVVSFLAGAVVFGFLVYREGWETIVQNIFGFGVWPFVGFVVLSLLNFVLYSWRWQLIVNSHLPKKQRLPLRRIYFHRMAGYAVSYLTPAAQVGGEPVRIGMLVSDGVAGKKATSSVILDITVELIAYVTFIAVGVVLAVATEIGQNNILLWIGLALVLALAFLFGLLFSLVRGNGYFSRMIRASRLHKMKRFRGLETWVEETETLMGSFLKGKNSLLVTIGLLSIAVISFRVVEVFYITWFLGVSVTFAQAFLIATLPGIALVLPVPAGVGIFEGGFAAVFAVLGVPLTAVAFSFIIRMRDLIFIAIGSMHALKRGGILLQKRKK
jgi:uncharacterized membrane protein YbhN (UPF0104 family)